MKKHNLLDANSEFGFKTYAVRDAGTIAFISAAKTWLQRSASILAVLALSFSSFTPAYAAAVDNGGGAVYDITCDNVSVVGDTWTFTGTWEVIDFQGQSTAYDVAMFAPSSAASPTDGSSKDSPDTFAITQGPSEFGGNAHNDDMSGTWSNEMVFASAPASVSATLFHAQVTGAESGDSTCRFTLPPTDTSTLTLVKVLDGDATTDVETDWTLTATGPDTITGATGDTEVTAAVVASGDYTLSESGPTSGYTASDWVCKDDADADVTVTNDEVTLVKDAEVTCTITNTFDDGTVPADTSTLTLVKALAGDATADVETDWTLTATGPDPISGATGDASITAAVVESGSYTLSESGPTSGYVASDWSCVDDAQATVAVTGGDTVTLAKDAVVTCTITNTFSTTPTYSVSGKVYNDNDPQNGTLDSESEDGLSGWIVYIDRNDNNDLDQGEENTESDANGDYIINGLDAGCYTVREVLQSGWNQTDPTVDPDGVENDFEYQVSIGGSTFCNPVSILSTIRDFIIPTANAAVNLNATGLNFGNVAVRRSGGGGGGGSSTTGRVLGDSTSIPYIAPEQGQVLGAATTLPVTGTPISVILMLMAITGFALIPLAATGAFKKD